MDIDADKRAAADSGKSQGGTLVIAQDIKTKWDFHCVAHGYSGSRHGRDRLRANASLGEGYIAEVLNKHRVRAAPLVSLRVANGISNDRVQIATPPWGAGQWLEMNHSDENLRAGVEESFHPQASADFEIG